MEQKTIDALKWILEILERHSVAYQISGGFAAKLYGSARPLNDIDIDVSEKSFPSILSGISQYITYGPARLNDGKWDCELITLKYHGQEIDLSGIDSMRMTNKARTEWIPYTQKFPALDMRVAGISIKVIHPRDLVAYKKELDGEHQVEDMQAVKKYIAQNAL